MNRIEVVLEALHIKIASRRGRRAWALCPMHADKNPTSFFVRLEGPRAGQAFCFSCKKGTTLNALVMHVRGCDYDTAKAFIDLLGKGYEPPKASVRFVERPPTLGRIRFKMPKEIRFKPVDEWVSGARKYALGRCQLTPDDIVQFKIGYAVDGRLAHRIILPWLRSDGSPAGYSARTFVNDEPKYQTPDSTENADRSVMFGEHLWEDRRRIVVTEGALNALAVRRAFLVPVGALGGSEIEPMQVIKLATFKQVILLTDSDEAGDKAAKNLESMLGRHTETVRIRLPEKKCPICKGTGRDLDMRCAKCRGTGVIAQDALDVGIDYLREVLNSVLSSSAS